MCRGACEAVWGGGVDENAMTVGVCGRCGAGALIAWHDGPDTVIVAVPLVPASMLAPSIIMTSCASASEMLTPTLVTADCDWACVVNIIVNLIPVLSRIILENLV